MARVEHMFDTGRMENAAARSATVRQLRREVERAGAAAPATGPALLPVTPGLEVLLPDGALRRGSLLEVVGPPGLALALAAGPVRSGAWAACVGLPHLGWPAAAAAGVDLSRTVVVEAPVRRWSAVMATLVESVDVVLCGTEPSPDATSVRRLLARARERGAVVLLVGAARGGWVGRADVRLQVVGTEWEGLGQGWGHLRGARTTVECTGRRGAARVRRVEVVLPGQGRHAVGGSALGGTG